MQERQIEDLLARVVLPPAPDSLKRRLLQRIGSDKPHAAFLRLTWIRAIEAAAAFALLAGTTGRAY